MFQATLCPSSGADDLVVFSGVLQCCNNGYPYMSNICGSLCSSVFMFLLGGLCGIVGYCGW